MNGNSKDNNVQIIVHEFKFSYMKTNKYILIQWNAQDKEESYYITNQNSEIHNYNIGYVPNFGRLEYELIADTSFCLKINDLKYNTITFRKPNFLSASLQKKVTQIFNSEGFTSLKEIENSDLTPLVLMPYAAPPPSPNYYVYTVKWKTENALYVEINGTKYDANISSVDISSTSISSLTLKAISEFGFYVEKLVKLS